MENITATIVEHKFLPLKMHLSIMRIKVHIESTNEDHEIEKDATTKELMHKFDFTETNGKYHLEDFNGRKCKVHFKDGVYKFVSMISR